MKSKSRIYYFDYLKIFAIFLVVFNHTETRGFFLFSQQTNSILFFPYMLISIADKVAVPLLFMVSGALLLGKQETVQTLWKKRISKYVVVIILFSFIRYLFKLATTKNQPFTILGFFRYIYAAPMEIPYWFLYAYLAALIMLPFLRKMAQNLSNQEFKYLICLQIIIVGILPALEYIFRMGSLYLNIPIVADSIIFYMLLGYYFRDKAESLSKNRSFMFVLWMLTIVTLILSAWMVMYQYKTTGILNEDSSQSFFNNFTPILAVTLFLSFSKLEKKINYNKRHYILNYFSNAILGVYLLEEMGRIVLSPIYTFFKPLVGEFLACWIWISIVIVVAAAVVNLLKLIPGLKKIL
ncbi:hypothetical protein DA798_10230 [Lactobacillus sp. PFC-70]|nr:hypothetical protein DA798_10230 [Lactobacillus sp. PFC-70]